jgi:hypothetical protein
MSFTLTFTTAGYNKLTAAISNNSTITLTHIAVGASATPLTVASTALGEERYRSTVQSSGLVGDTYTLTGIVPVNQGGWYIRELGIFDVDATLIAFSQFPETYKPLPSTDNVGVNLNISATLNVINADNVSVTIESSYEIIFRKGTDAERQTVVFAEGEGIYTTDKKEFWIGDGVTLGGVRPNPSYVLNTGSNGIAGSNLGGSGTPGAAGTTVTPIVDIDGGNGGANAASGTGNGGAASTIATPVLLKITGGNGGAANGNNAGGTAGALLGANLIQITGNSGGSASTGRAGTNGTPVMSLGGLLRVDGASSGAGSTGTGVGGFASSILYRAGSALISLQGGSGGNANGDFSGGNGGGVFPSNSQYAIRIVAANGGPAGVGGSGGHGGVIATSFGLLSFEGGSGGAGGSGAPGGAGGIINVIALRVKAGAGGAGGAAGETGGAGGAGGGITLNGGAGDTGTGGLAGGAGGAGGYLSLDGGAASGTTPGGAGGVINLSAIGTTPSAKINFGTAAPESSVTAPPGSLYLRNNAGAGEMWLKTSGTGNTGWTLK